MTMKKPTKLEKNEFRLFLAGWESALHVSYHQGAFTASKTVCERKFWQFKKEINLRCPCCGCRPFLHERHAFSCEWGE